MFDKTGQKTWEAELDIYGKVRKLAAGSLNDCPFRYQGQYEDVETGLYYNRFRYYDPEDGVYVSQDPIGLNGNNPNIYAYTNDPNIWVDFFGLSLIEFSITSHGSQPTPRSPYQSHHLIQDEWAKNQGLTNYKSTEAPSILLDATAGESNKHAIVTSRQNARRDARINAGEGKWSTSFNQELKNMEDDLRAAGVPEHKIKEAKKKAKKFFNNCK